MSQPTNIIWEDAEQLALQHPETFTRPGPKRLEALRAEDMAKVCTCNERFWCIVLERNGKDFRGKVDNDLQHTDEHGLRVNDIVHFEERHIYQALLKQDDSSDVKYR